ncbi:hypothetical protein NDU88_006668 [Pleurodeles waltl]|uniref:Uncharacterized protein n=1 Tax=Pleurodeles waltl TaxID=8319 RepID=A0AAV7WFG2_PLEWA|nr:hypothetical protein NDU88_006668 [Pleurodeles waltl]
MMLPTPDYSRAGVCEFGVREAPISTIARLEQEKVKGVMLPASDHSQCKFRTNTEVSSLFVHQKSYESWNALRDLAKTPRSHSATHARGAPPESLGFVGHVEKFDVSYKTSPSEAGVKPLLRVRAYIRLTIRIETQKKFSVCTKLRKQFLGAEPPRNRTPKSARVSASQITGQLPGK